MNLMSYYLWVSFKQWIGRSKSFSFESIFETDTCLVVQSRGCLFDPWMYTFKYVASCRKVCQQSHQHKFWWPTKSNTQTHDTQHNNTTTQQYPVVERSHWPACARRSLCRCRRHPSVQVAGGQRPPRSVLPASYSSHNASPEEGTEKRYSRLKRIVKCMHSRI